MTLGELQSLIARGIKDGKLDPDDDVLIRNTAIGQATMDAGSSGYAELSEVLIVDGVVHLLIEEW